MLSKIPGHLLFIGLITLLVMPAKNFAQSEIVRLYERDEFVELEKMLNSGPDKDNLFLQSIFKTDAKEAIEMMKKMIKKDPKSEFLPAVMERIGFYQFSTGLYSTAQKPFKYLAENYANTVYGETGLYNLARCYQGKADSDSGLLVLEEFLRKYPRSKYSNLILQELRAGLKLTDSEKKVEKANPLITGKAEIFTVQTGAFSTNTNARIQKQFLEEKGFQPSIYTKWVDRKKYFVVCLKKFPAKNEAESYGREIAKKYKLDFRVIDVNELQPVR